MKKERRGPRKTPRWYLYLVSAYALIGIIDSMILYNGIRLLLPIFTVLGVVWVLFNACMLFYFKDGFETRSYILPTYYVGFFFISYVLVSIIHSMSSIILIQLVFSCLELLAALYFINT